MQWTLILAGYAARFNILQFSYLIVETYELVPSVSVTSTELNGTYIKKESAYICFVVHAEGADRGAIGVLVSKDF